MKDRRILFFINPVSGPRRKPRLKNLIVEWCLAHNVHFDIAFTNAAAEYPWLPDRIKNEGFTDVVVCGGDGTINQVGSHLLGCKVNLGIIPAGSGNGLALAARIPKNTEKALAVIFKGTPTCIDAFFINQQFSCMLCGVGFDAQVAHDFANQPARGLVTYVKQSVKNFISAKPYHFDITIDGNTFSTEAFFISVANSNQFGNNFTIAPKASLTDGLLDVIVVKKMSKARMIWAVLQQIRKGEVGQQEERNFHEREVLYFQTGKLVIHNHQLAPLHIDGDPADTDKKFEIEILQNALKLIMP